MGNLMNLFTKEPLVSVILPVYNAGDFLIPAVKSIIFQTYQNWELLLIDDCSTDNALLDLQEKLSDPRIKIFRNSSNQGVTARLNQGIDLAKGSFLARMDQDDICFPERLAKQVKLLLQDTDLDLVGTGAILISPDGHPLGYYPSRVQHDQIVSKPWHTFYLPHPTWMGRIEWFRRYRYLTCLCEDQGLLLRSYKNSKFAATADILFAYRLRDNFNFPVILKTRLSCLSQQISFFRQQHLLHYVVLSILVFALKHTRDFLIYKILKKSPILFFNKTELSINDAEIWRHVYKLVHTN